MPGVTVGLQLCLFRLQDPVLAGDQPHLLLHLLELLRSI